MVVKASTVGRNQSGSVLIISMIILIVFAAIISVLALIVVSNLRYVESYSQAQQSYYFAEAGIEQGLYYTQASKTAKVIDVTSLDTLIGAVASSNMAQYTIEFTANSDSSLTIPLTNQETKQLNLYTETYNTTDGYLETTALPISALALRWTDASCNDSAGNVHSNSVELNDTSWTAQNWDAVTQNRWVYNACGAGCSHGLQADFLYKVRFKSLYCTINDFTISATDATGSAVSLQDTVTLTGTGRSGKTQQQVTAKVLWRSPLINYFDYVLFSEEQVTK